jgi:ribosomal protein S18 acetylase RimI-like enzyme
MSFLISEASPQDAQELSTLVNSAYRGDTSRQGWTTEADLLDGTRTTPEILKEIIDRSDCTILKYEESGKILGCVELRKDHTRLYLGMLTVAPEFQSRGIGKELLKASEKKAIQLGCHSIFMTVISVRKELIDWYKRHGYQDTLQRKPFVLPDSRWGIPKRSFEFAVLEKQIASPRRSRYLRL